jgi:hypothetical protein
MLQRCPAKLKNQFWRHDVPMFRSGLPKSINFVKNMNLLDIFTKAILRILMDVSCCTEVMQILKNYCGDMTHLCFGVVFRKTRNDHSKLFYVGILMDVLGCTVVRNAKKINRGNMTLLCFGVGFQTLNFEKIENDLDFLPRILMDSIAHMNLRALDSF